MKKMSKYKIFVQELSETLPKMRRNREMMILMKKIYDGLGHKLALLARIVTIDLMGGPLMDRSGLRFSNL